MMKAIFSTMTRRSCGTGEHEMPEFIVSEIVGDLAIIFLGPKRK